MNASNYKEITEQLRNLIKAKGIKARCRLFVSCGEKNIQVYTVKYELEFSENEQREIRTIAKSLGLTKVRRIEIDVERMTDPKSFDFVFHG